MGTIYTGEDSRHGFRFNTSEGRIFECAVEGNDAQAECDAWLDVMPTTKSTVVRGYLHTREKKGGDGERARDRRYAGVQHMTVY